jgi:predicted RND superfamily exporter protein
LNSIRCLMKEKFLNFIENKPKLAILIPPLFTVAILFGLMNFTSNFSPRVWFADGTPMIDKLDFFEKTFGSDQFINIGVYDPKGKINDGDLELLKKITDDLWMLPDVLRVESITNFNDIYSEGDDIFVEGLGDTYTDASKFHERMKTIEQVKDLYVSPTHDYYVFFAHLKPFFGKNPDFTPVVNAAKEYVKTLEQRGLKYYVIGSATVTNAFRNVTKEDNARMIPLMFAIIIALLYYRYRNIFSVAATLVLAGMTIGSAFGFMSLIGITYTGILGAIPGILLAICLADSIHIFMTFYQEQARGKSIQDALNKSLRKNFLPTILTTITTMISFATIAWTELVPVHDLGVVAAFGTMCAWFYTYLFCAPLVYMFPEKFKIKDKNLFLKDESSMKRSPFIEKVDKYKIPIIIFTVFLVIGGFIKSLENEVNSDPVEYFAKTNEVKKAYDFAKTKLNGLRGVNYIVDSGKAEGAKDPEFLNRLNEFTKWIEAEPEIMQTNSIIDILKEMNFVLNASKGEKTLPQTRKGVAEQLLLYQMGLPQGAGTENQISVDNRYLRYRISWNIEKINQQMNKSELIVKTAKEKFNLDIEAGGNFPIYTTVNDLVVESFLKSMSLMIFLVSIILFIVFKDFLISFISLLPNVIPLIVGTTVMAIWGIYLDIGTSLVAAICLGIAVDDTIHFVTSYLQGKKEGRPVFEAVSRTFEGTGKALILTTVVLVCGFGSFVFAEFLPNRYFGVLCAIVLSFALITDLVLLPAILLKFDKTKNV